MTVPLVLAGPGIRRGYEITTPVSIMDIAPTIVRLLNLSAPAEWEGRCIDEAFL